MPEMGIGKFPNVKTDKIYLDRENLDVLIERVAADIAGLGTGDKWAIDELLLDRANRDIRFHRSGANEVTLDDDLAMAAGKTVDGTDISAHVADPDAHTRNPWEKLRTGEYHNTVQAASATMILPANRLFASPFLIAVTTPIEELAIEISAGDSGKSARLGIYNDGVNLYPGSLVADSEGEISVAATGIISVTYIPALSLTKGLYWLAIVSDGTPTVTRQVGNVRIFIPLMGVKSTNFGANNTGWYVAHTYNGLPDPYTAGGTLCDGVGYDLPFVAPLLES